MKNISRAFPGVKAVNDVSFSVDKGEIVSLIGQNGAGKSTLVSIIGGIYTPNAGEIFIRGKKRKISDPAVSEQLGIGMVHQEPTLVPAMSVAANIFLNRETVKGKLFLNFSTMAEESKKIINYLGFDIDPEILVEELSLVEREVVEIAKAMLSKPRILILDEVTAPLGEDEANNLFKLIEELKAGGMAIVFISHRLKEVKLIADRIFVMRNGKKAGELAKSDNPSEKEIIALMLGKSVVEQEKEIIKREDASILACDTENPFLVVNNLSCGRHFSEINIELCRGEILGLAGLKGSGITEIFKTIFGLMRKDCGDILIDRQPVKIKHPKDAITNGIGMITNDRQQEGLALIRNLTENITVSSLSKYKNRVGFLQTRKMMQSTKKFIELLDIKTSSIKKEVMFLSGGNQQKVVISKWLLRDLQVILIDEPTRGVDVGAIGDIHSLLLDLKNEGKSIMITSPEITELLRICDRILVVSKGKITDEVPRISEKFNETYILENMHI